MKKIILAVTLQCLMAGWSYAGWPINRTPRIEGVVTDATTGEPVENVIVSAKWEKSVATPVDMVTKYCGSHIAITDKDGKYKIPAKISIHLLSWFEDVMINIGHPLYESKAWISVRKLEAWDLRKEHKQYDGKYGIKISTAPPRWDYDLWVEDHGVIRYDVKLLSLEEKYVKAIKEGKKELTLKFLNRIENRKFLFEIYREKNRVIDINEIAEQYEKWSKDVPESRALRDIMKGIRKEITNYRNWMEDK